jgi:hypothetical protein
VITVHVQGASPQLPVPTLGAVVIGACHVRKDGAHIANAALVAITPEEGAIYYAALWWDRYADPPQWALTPLRP